ncbi:hypothetical protein ABI59_19065 [Acidobacteria bacterium Mor1]|nr:hypothetical protein ABI59_19065 [Acidobacteria bacterium Mor1]
MNRKPHPGLLLLSFAIALGVMFTPEIWSAAILAGFFGIPLFTLGVVLRDLIYENMHTPRRPPVSGGLRLAHVPARTYLRFPRFR